MRTPLFFVHTVYNFHVFLNVTQTYELSLLFVHVTVILPTVLFSHFGHYCNKCLLACYHCHHSAISLIINITTSVS